MTQPTMPVEILEKRAAEQRRALHKDVQQLRTVVEAEVRDHLDVKRNVSRYFGRVAAATALIALSVGYSFAGIFTKR